MKVLIFNSNRIAMLNCDPVVYIYIHARKEKVSFAIPELIFEHLPEFYQVTRL